LYLKKTLNYIVAFWRFKRFTYRGICVIYILHWRQFSFPLKYIYTCACVRACV